MAACSHGSDRVTGLSSARTDVADMKIGIVGGGISGLALAFRLANDGHRVSVLEQAEQPGGLATWQDHGPFEFDRFYHVILPTDRHLVRFIEDIGLADELLWRKTETGFFVDDEFPLLFTDQ